MKIEILYFDGCPHHAPAVERVQSILAELGLANEVLQVPVTDPAMARAVGFLGSPSVRIDGLDVEPQARTSDQVGFGCRTYWSETGLEGLPSIQMIRKAMLAAGLESRSPLQSN